MIRTWIKVPFLLKRSEGCYKTPRNFTITASLLCSFTLVLVTLVLNRNGDSGNHLGLILVEILLFPYWEDILGRLGHCNCTIITGVAKLQLSS